MFTFLSVLSLFWPVSGEGCCVAGNVGMYLSDSRKIAMKPNATQETAAPFLTAAELRQRWRVSGMFLWRMRQKNRLPIYKIGSRGVRFAMADVLKIESEAAV